MPRRAVPSPSDAAAQPAIDEEPKPLWRGWIHAVTVPFAIALGVILIATAATPATKIGSAVFMVTSILLFGTSALYHRIRWSPPVKATFRRIDHANIFLLIAGTYTPISLAALEWPKNLVLLSVIWGGALLGIIFRIFWLRAPRWLYVPLYILLGWAALVYFVDLFVFSVPMMTLVLLGGLAYTAGAVFYALKRPNPVPGVFGFHEIFHSCTVIAFALQWSGVLIAVQHPVL